MNEMTYYIRKYKLQLVSETKVDINKLTSSKDVYKIIKDHFDQELNWYQEHFVVIGLDRANNPVMIQTISSGGITGTVVDKRIILKYLIESLCTGCIFVHNHPSGNLRPSNNDIKITNDSVKGFKLLEISLLDHLIISNDSYYSFADSGMI
jgi:DNA repair protein RadC